MFNSDNHNPICFQETVGIYKQYSIGVSNRMMNSENIYFSIIPGRDQVSSTKGQAGVIEYNLFPTSTLHILHIKSQHIHKILLNGGGPV